MLNGGKVLVLHVHVHSQFGIGSGGGEATEEIHHVIVTFVFGLVKKDDLPVLLVAIALVKDTQHLVEMIVDLAV